MNWEPRDEQAAKILAAVAAGDWDVDDLSRVRVKEFTRGDRRPQLSDSELLRVLQLVCSHTDDGWFLVPNAFQYLSRVITVEPTPDGQEVDRSSLRPALKKIAGEAAFLDGEESRDTDDVFTCSAVGVRENKNRTPTMRAIINECFVEEGDRLVLTEEAAANLVREVDRASNSRR